MLLVYVYVCHLVRTPGAFHQQPGVNLFPAPTIFEPCVLPKVTSHLILNSTECRSHGPYHTDLLEQNGLYFSWRGIKWVQNGLFLHKSQLLFFYITLSKKFRASVNVLVIMYSPPAQFVITLYEGMLSTSHPLWSVKTLYKSWISAASKFSIESAINSTP